MTNRKVANLADHVASVADLAETLGDHRHVGGDTSARHRWVVVVYIDVDREAAGQEGGSRRGAKLVSIVAVQPEPGARQGVDMW